jgi:hypothetical protein
MTFARTKTLIYKLAFILFSILISIRGQSQDLDKINNNLSYTISKVADNISSENGCRDLLNDIDDIKDDINELLENRNQLSSQDKEALKLNLIKCEALDNFIRTVGNTRSAKNFLSDKEMNLVRGILNFDIYELPKYKFCATVYQIQINDYICLLVKKSGYKEIFRVTAELVTSNGMSSSKLDFGVQANHYRGILNNVDNRDFGKYRIKSMTCVASYY